MKHKLHYIIDNVIDSIDISKLDDNQKIKLLQVGIKYLVTRLKHTSNDDGWVEQPIFPKVVDIITRDGDGELQNDIRPINSNTNKVIDK